VREFLEEAFRYVWLDWKKHVKFDPRYLRPTEVDYLKGDAGKARRVLGWKNETSLKQLVARMVDHDMQRANSGESRDA
jgi:GDPmannose 4,6-dehydratase